MPGGCVLYFDQIRFGRVLFQVVQVDCKQMWLNARVSDFFHYFGNERYVRHWTVIV